MKFAMKFAIKFMMKVFMRLCMSTFIQFIISQGLGRRTRVGLIIVCGRSDRGRRRPCWCR